MEEIEVAPPQANEVRIKVRDVNLQDPLRYTQSDVFQHFWKIWIQSLTGLLTLQHLWLLCYEWTVVLCCKGFNQLSVANAWKKSTFPNQETSESVFIVRSLSLVQIVATGVCHTDLYHLFEGMHKDGFPAVLGHEGAGIIESVGPGVTEFQPGE